MPSTQGRIYLGSILVASPGETWDYTQPYPPDAGTDAVWTIPGTLQQTFTTSGTYTPAVGVSTVHVMVVGGGGIGGHGGQGTGTGDARSSAGGAGGQVVVYRDVPVSGPVAVTIGGSETASSFGALSAAAGGSANTYGAGTNANAGRAGFGGGGAFGDVNGWNRLGRAGVTVNGVVYGGGGSGALWYSNTEGNTLMPGGAGGGGQGSTYNSWSAYSTVASNGSNGYGGGAGGGRSGENTSKIGGSGRVMIWSEDV